MTDSRARGWSIWLLMGVAVGWCAWNWLRLPSLLYGDNLRWMSEASRAARGEVIYRDFASMYPPLGIAYAAAAYRFLSASFLASQVVVCTLSFATMMVTWRLARRFVSEPIAVGTAVALTFAGATNAGNFAFFSLRLYTPSILCGSVGLGMALVGLTDAARGRRGMFVWALIALGTNIALLSKLEHGMAALVALGVQALVGLPAQRASRLRWLGARAVLALLGVLPALAVYAWLARVVGIQDLRDGLGGYGIASQFCPVWPTGLGLLGAAGAIGQAAALVAVLALVRRRHRWFVEGRGWRWGLVLVVGACLWALHLPYALEGFARAQPGLRGPALLFGFVFSLTGLLTPIMWASIAVLGMLAVRCVAALVRRQPLPPADAGLLVLLSAGAALASRGLFGHMFGNTTVAHQSSYMLWFVATPYLVVRVLRWLDSRPAAADDLISVDGQLPASPTRYELLVLCAVGIVGVAPRTLATILRESKGPVLVTEAGSVYVSDPASRAIYGYVMSRTTADDTLLESPLSGGISFASRRRSAVHSMQFLGLMTPKRLMQRDVELLSRHPPRLVIASAYKHLSAVYGICGYVACTFPRFVWRSDRLACLPEVVPDAIAFVESHYSEAARFANFVVLQPNRLSPSN